MCENCNCKISENKFQYKCDCKSKDCSCTSVIGFEEDPKLIPYCCGVPMKRIK